jgi:hypothetical protein
MTVKETTYFKQHFFSFIQNSLETLSVEENISTLNFHVKSFFQKWSGHRTSQNARNIYIGLSSRFCFVQQSFPSSKQRIVAIGPEKKEKQCQNIILDCQVPSGSFGLIMV